MILKYDIAVSGDTVKTNLKRLTNQIYKLLPFREEGGEWAKPLQTIIEEFAGMDRLFLSNHSLFFSLMCKLEGLFTLTQENDFFLFRKTIFECLNIVSELKDYVED